MVGFYRDSLLSIKGDAKNTVETRVSEAFGLEPDALGSPRSRARMGLALEPIPEALALKPAIFMCRLEEDIALLQILSNFTTFIQRQYILCLSELLQRLHCL